MKASAGHQTGQGSGPERSEDWTELRLRKVGGSERASAQEDRKVTKQLRLPKTDGTKGASRTNRKAGKAQARNAEDESWRNPAESKRPTDVDKERRE